jgi:hypothetical protein
MRVRRSSAASVRNAAVIAGVFILALNLALYVSPPGAGDAGCGLAGEAS